jgi:hypothetical protein
MAHDRKLVRQKKSGCPQKFYALFEMSKIRKKWLLSLSCAEVSGFQEYLHEVRLNACAIRRRDSSTDYLISGDKQEIEEHLSFYFDGRYEINFENE